MPKFIIEREIPGIGASPAGKLRHAAQKSNAILRELGPEIQWVESYVLADRTVCVYIAPSRELIEEHSRRSGFPANKITQVDAIIDPTTAEGEG